MQCDHLQAGQRPGHWTINQPFHFSETVSIVDCQMSKFSQGITNHKGHEFPCMINFSSLVKHMATNQSDGEIVSPAP